MEEELGSRMDDLLKGPPVFIKDRGKKRITIKVNQPWINCDKQEYDRRKKMPIPECKQVCPFCHKHILKFTEYLRHVANCEFNPNKRKK